jgi:hypothetical protein
MDAAELGDPEVFGRAAGAAGGAKRPVMTSTSTMNRIRNRLIWNHDERSRRACQEDILRIH